jgi:hypothetical protein
MVGSMGHNISVVGIVNAAARDIYVLSSCKESLSVSGRERLRHVARAYGSSVTAG